MTVVQQLLMFTPSPAPSTEELVEVSNFGGPPAYLFYLVGAILLVGVVATAALRSRRR